MRLVYNYWKIQYPCSSILNVSSCLSRNRKILFKGQEGCLGDMWGIDYAGFLISCDLQLWLDHASAGRCKVKSLTETMIGCAETMQNY